jgi:hypothetical protein
MLDVETLVNTPASCFVKREAMLEWAETAQLQDYTCISPSTRNAIFNFMMPADITDKKLKLKYKNVRENLLLAAQHNGEDVRRRRTRAFSDA